MICSRLVVLESSVYARHNLRFTEIRSQNRINVAHGICDFVPTLDSQMAYPCSIPTPFRFLHPSQKPKPSLYIVLPCEQSLHATNTCAKSLHTLADLRLACQNKPALLRMQGADTHNTDVL